MQKLSPISKSAVALLLVASLFGGPVLAQSKGADSFGVGDTLKPNQVHIITNPGLYGLGSAPGNSKYAVAKGKLIRINPSNLKVKSILRSQAKILD